MGWRGGVLAGVVAACVPATASAMQPCPGAPTAVAPVLQGQGTLESAIVDARGRLFYTDVTLGVLRRIDAPGQPPQTIATIHEPGGLAIDDAGRILVGSGDGLATGASGNLMPHAQLMRVAPDGGPVEVVASGLQMANGVARAADGTVFASSDVGLGIDRIAPDGKVAVRWATVVSSNGLAIDRAQRYLYAAQTFQPAAIVRVDLRDPARTQTYASAPLADFAAGLDGMTIDADDRLYAAAQVPGEIWRVNADRGICAVGTGLKNPSAVAFGHGDRGFSEGRLFAVSFSGTIAEVPAARLPVARATPAPRVVRVLFQPLTAHVRRGVVHIRPQVFAVLDNGTRQPRSVRVTIAGRRGRTGKLLSIRVGARTRVLTARFTVRGVRRTRTITLQRP